MPAPGRRGCAGRACHCGCSRHGQRLSGRYGGLFDLSLRIAGAALDFGRRASANGPMHTPEGFTPSHVRPDSLPAGTLAFAFRDDKLLVGRPRGRARSSPNRPRSRTSASAATRHYLGELAGIACVAVPLPANAPEPAGLALRRSAIAVLPPARTAARDRSARLPGRRVGPHASVLRPLRNADPRQAGRAREGMPRVRLRRLSARRRRR